MLRAHGVVGKFVEFYGPGCQALSLADRATIANMAPEYGATMGFFPVDEKTVEYPTLTGRSPEKVKLIEAYMREVRGARRARTRRIAPLSPFLRSRGIQEHPGLSRVIQEYLGVSAMIHTYRQLSRI